MSAIVFAMNRIASVVTLVGLLAPLGCKQKQHAPTLAGSAVAPLKAAPVRPAAEPLAGHFEGEVAVLAHGKFAGKDGAPIALKLLTKDGKLRVDVPDNLTATRGLGKAYLLAFPAEKKLYAILAEKKQAVLLELDKLAGQASAFGSRAKANGGSMPAAQPRVTKTGKVDTVAGIECEIWHYAQEKSEGDACLAEQETPWFQLPSGSASPELVGLSPIADGKHFPLRFIWSEQGVERGRVEVTRVARKALAASEFELPADYTVLTLDQMMDSMLGGLGLPRGLELRPGGLQLPPGVQSSPGPDLPSAARSAAPPPQ